MGTVRVTSIEVGRLRFDLAEAYGPGAVAGLGEEDLAGIPVQAFHLDLPGRSVLVDAPHYDPADTPEAYLLLGYRPPPPLADQLRARGIPPEGVSDVILTHLHFDHYGGLTTLAADGWRPAFPNARHYVGRGDWPPDPTRLGPLVERSVAEIERCGLLVRTGADGASGTDIEMGDGLSIVPAPGESPGHQLARAQLGDDVVYVVGDLFHHSLEFRGSGMDVRWVDAGKMAASKRMLAERAADEGARVYISHIAGAHKVARSCGGFKWIRADGAAR